MGRFAGLVRIPNGDTTQEVMKIVYQNEDVVFVSIHSLHKVSSTRERRVKRPVSTSSTGAWEKLKDRTKTKIKDIARDLIKTLLATPRGEGGSNTIPTASCSGSWKPHFIYEDTPPDQSKGYFRREGRHGECPSDGPPGVR